MPTFSLEAGPEIELRLVEPDDAEDLFAIIDRDREYLREWLPWVDQSRTVEDNLRFIAGARARFADNQGFNCSIRHRGLIGGTIGLDVRWRDRACSIGYWLASGLQGRGIMTASCRAVIDYAFGDLSLHRVEIRCATGNTRSCAIPARLGFTREGVLRGAEWVNDRFLDLVVWGLLESEWRRDSGGS